MRSGGAGNIRATMASSILFLAALSLGVCGELKETYSASLHRRGAALSGSGSGGGPTPVAIPTCATDNEFLSSDGTKLSCKKIPPCTCFVDGQPGQAPRPQPSPLSNPPTQQPTQQPGTSPPLPPTGCPVFQPPLRGAFVCYLNSTLNLMLCSVYCDYRFEFQFTPQNPYFCGPSTSFQWSDSTEQTYNALPQCTAHKTSRSQTHGYHNYIPAPCYGLTSHTIVAIMNEFRERLRKLGYVSVEDDVFMQCPAFGGRVYFYRDTALRNK